VGRVVEGELALQPSEEGAIVGGHDILNPGVSTLEDEKGGGNTLSLVEPLKGSGGTDGKGKRGKMRGVTSTESLHKVQGVGGG